VAGLKARKNHESYQHGLFAVRPVGQTPNLAARGRDVQKQAVAVKQLDGLTPWFCFLDLGICQSHYLPSAPTAVGRHTYKFTYARPWI
jgi:hypothetical protein